MVPLAADALMPVLSEDTPGKLATVNWPKLDACWLPLTLCHFQHFDLLLRGGAHFLNRGQDGRQRLDQSLF